MTCYEGNYREVTCDEGNYREVTYDEGNYGEVTCDEGNYKVIRSDPTRSIKIYDAIQQKVHKSWKIAFSRMQSKLVEIVRNVKKKIKSIDV